MQNFNWLSSEDSSVNEVKKISALNRERGKSKLNLVKKYL